MPARRPSRAEPAEGDPSATYLSTRIDLVVARLQALLRERLGEGSAREALAGADTDLAALDAAAEAVEEAGGSIRLRDHATLFGLVPQAVEVLVVGIAWEVDARVRDLCGALRGLDGPARPTVGLALSLIGHDADQLGAVGVLDERSALVRHHLVEVERSDLALADRPWSTPDRVVEAALGIRAIDPALRLLELPRVAVPSAEADRLARAIHNGVRLVYVRERPSVSGHSLAASAFAALGIPAVSFDLRRAGADHSAYGLAAAMSREAGLADSGLVVGPIDELVRTDVAALGPLGHGSWPTILVGSVAWDPVWSHVVPLVVEAPRTDPSELDALWRRSFDDAGLEVTDEVADAISSVRLTPEQSVRAAVAARLEAAADGTGLTAEHVRRGARSQAAGRLEQLATRVQPGARFDDLVLPDHVLDQVRQIVERHRHRDLVVGTWGAAGPGSRRRGTTALFTGDSGTGKTLSAEAVASELGVDLYVIDLSTVVDKYVGETEKNLGRVFDEAEGLQGVLFFDEADALFGKRTDASDAHDRHANVEVAYLLQRMEQFEGIAVLATNLRANIDEAFTRRLDLIVHYQLPQRDARLLLWQRHLPPSVPQAELDLELLADTVEVAGGVIRNVTLTAAFRAAQDESPVTMGHLARALGSEFTKMGRLFDPGPLASFLDDGEAETPPTTPRRRSPARR